MEGGESVKCTVTMLTKYINKVAEEKCLTVTAPFSTDYHKTNISPEMRAECASDVARLNTPPRLRTNKGDLVVDFRHSSARLCLL